MPTQKEGQGQGVSFHNLALARMRRRQARLGAIVAVLATALLTAGATVCAWLIARR